MKLVVLSDKCIGSVLAKAIYSKSGTIILNKGGTLSSAALKRLKEFGIYSIYIEAEGTEDIIVQEAIDINTQISAIKELEKIFDMVKKKGDFDESNIKEIVKKNLESLSLSENTLLVSNGLRTVEHNIHVHSLNVGILSAVIGIGLGYNFEKLYNLALGAVLHDIGYALTDGKDHTLKGMDILKKRVGISTTSYIIAAQHHERVDGLGYPKGIKKNDIYEFSKIVAVCNEYDNLISKNGLMPFEALEEIIGRTGTFFDEDIVKIFQKSICIYPTGMEVKLSNGEIGVVFQQNKGMPTRPIIKTHNRYYNLLEELTLFVENIKEE